MKTNHPISQVLLKARACGYRCADFAKINIAYKFVTKPNDFLVHLIGDEIVVVEFEKFEVEELSKFVDEFHAHKDGAKYTRDEIQEFVIGHFKDLVAKYLKTGDTLKHGDGMLGPHQMVYVEDSEAWREHLRLEQWQKDRSERLRQERAAQNGL